MKQSTQLPCRMHARHGTGGSHFIHEIIGSHLALLTIDDRPPLANQLFDRVPRFNTIAAKYRQIASIANDVRAKVNSGQQLRQVYLK